MKENKNISIDEMTINYIKSLAIDMISEAGSGHPGIVLGAAPIIYTVYKDHLRYSTVDTTWINRDRFVMSAGHGSALLYAMLYVAGFNLTINDLKQFRRLNSKTPGHPELGVTSGVDMTTGPLGQGLASAVGMAIGGKINQQKYLLEKGNRLFSIDKPIFDYNVYVLASDGDLMEGVAQEALSLAGNLQLNNLIVLYDSNNISLDGDIANTYSENTIERFRSMNWNTIYVEDGNNLSAINRAINDAKAADKPTLIEIKTIIGQGTKLAGTNKIHGKVLDASEVEQLKGTLNLPLDKFYIPKSSIDHFQSSVNKRYQKYYYPWAEAYKNYVEQKYNGDYNLFSNMINSRFTLNLNKLNWESLQDEQKSLRDINGQIMVRLAGMISTFIGGSADLASSTKTYLFKQEDITKENYNGKNIWFGVREHAMGAILNGLALVGFRPFGSTFLSFADYQKPAIRLSALMNLPVTYIYTHDSISVGQDGPTHQPIEQLAMLRSTPNLNVFRPADMNELIGCWNEILNNRQPNCLIVSRNPVQQLSTTNSKEIKYGAYIVKKEQLKLDGIIIATGTEVQTAYNISIELLKEHNIDLRVVSMPAMEVFLSRPSDYQNKIIPQTVKRIVIEAGSSFGWNQFVSDKNHLITIDMFGTSGTREEVYKYCDFSYERIKNRIINMFK